MLEHHDPAGCGRLTGPKSREDYPRVERKVGPKSIAMLGEMAAIRRRVSHEKNNDADRAIATFQGNSTVECLKVGKTHLRLDADGREAKTALAVPSAVVSGDRQWHLGSPQGAGRKLIPEPLEKSSVSGVADRMAVGIGASDELQADGRTRNRELAGGDIR